MPTPDTVRHPDDAQGGEPAGRAGDARPAVVSDLDDRYLQVVCLPGLRFYPFHGEQLPRLAHLSEEGADGFAASR